MAYTLPKTFGFEEVLPASDLNTHLRDAVRWLAQDHWRVKARITSAVAVGTDTDHNLVFNATDEYDVGALHDHTGGTVPATRITIPAMPAGITQADIEFTASAIWNENTAELARRIWIQRNDGVIIWKEARDATENTGSATTTVGPITVRCTAAQWFSVYVRHGVALPINVNDAYFSARWIAFAP